MARGKAVENSRPVGRPKDGDSAITRQTVVGAAMHLFGHRGFDGTALDAIAKRAGLTPATLYHHFGGKEGIYRAAYDDVMAGIVDVFERSVDHKRDLHDNFAAMIRASIVMTAENPTRSRFAAAIPFERLRHPEMFGPFEPVSAFIIEMVHRGIVAGVVDPTVDAHRVATIVGVVLSGLTTVASATPESYGPVAEDVTRLVVFGRLPTSAPTLGAHGEG